MFTIGNIIDYSGVAGCAINIVQSERIHSHEVADAKRRHQESTALAVSQHEKDMKIAKQTYLMAAFTSLEQHFQVTALLYSNYLERLKKLWDCQIFSSIIAFTRLKFFSIYSN